MANLFLGLVLLLAWPAVCLGDEPSLFDVRTGLRIDRYRAPLPAEMEGARTVGLEQVDTLKAHGAVLLDVHPARLPLEPLHELWPAAETRMTIPGAVWLPEVGRGQPDASVIAYFEKALAQLTKGRRQHAVVVFCQTDCWMSWNALKRAHRLGYEALNWFQPGIDGWKEAGRALKPVAPYRFADEASEPQR